MEEVNMIILGHVQMCTVNGHPKLVNVDYVIVAIVFCELSSIYTTYNFKYSAQSGHTEKKCLLNNMKQEESARERALCQLTECF